jgi:pimeloyl-ACP methyl ester carboxylesterase
MQSSSVVRKTSPSTGLLYLSRSPRHGAVRKLYLFIHGWGCTSLDYLPLLDALAGADSTSLYIAPDLPGHGESPTSLCPRPTVFDFAALLNRLCHEACVAHHERAQGGEVTEEVAEKISGTSSFPASEINLLHVLEIERVIVGHSMGCRIALEIFSQAPEKVSAVVLLDGSWYGHSEKTLKPVGRAIDEERRVILKSLETMFGPNTPDQFKHRVTQQFKEIDLVYAIELGRDYLAWEGERGRMEEVLQMVRKNKRTDFGTTEVLVVQGTEGRGGTRRSLRKGEEASWTRLVRERVGERFTGLVVEDSGHWPHVDKTDEVAQAITNIANER